MRHTVTLSPVELMKVLHYASVCHETKRISNQRNEVTNHRYAEDIDDFTMHMIGLMGEAAVCKYLGVNFHVDIHKFGDDGNDIVINGYKIQVKTLSKERRDPLLYVNDIDKVSSDILVGGFVSSPTSITLFGAASKSHFKRVMHEVDFGYGKRDAVSEEDLRPLDAMVNFLNGGANGH
jgi:hypothetical protein